MGRAVHIVPGLTPDQQELANVMSDTSEWAYSASWYVDTEYRLWRFVIDPSDNAQFGFVTLPESLRGRLAELSKRIGGWIFYRSRDDEPGEGKDLCAVSLADWRAMYARSLRLDSSPSLIQTPPT
jgi:hypothetical protein